MVHHETNKRKTVEHIDISSTILAFVILIILVATTTLVAYYLTSAPLENDIEVNISDDGGASSDSEIKEIEVEKIDFQPIVDSWANSVSGSKSIVIYDLERKETVGSYNVDEIHLTASLYKLFVVYEGYRRVQNGELDADEPAGLTGYTILECLDLAIRESNSRCAETIWQRIGEDELDKIMKKELNVTQLNVSNLSLRVKDIRNILRLFYEHPHIKDEALVARMKDSFLNQPATEYNWRQGLPSGFSNKVNVYNKVGWDYNEDGYWNTYNDAAIIEFPEQNRHFIVVVMTNRIPYQQIRKLGAEIEEVFFNNY